MASGAYQEIITVENKDSMITPDMEPVHVQVIKKSSEFYNTIQTVISLHHLGTVGGLVLIVDGILGLFFGYSLGLTGLQILNEFFMIAFGVILIFIEYPTLADMSKFRRKLHHFARFLFVPMGRGCFYTYITCLLFSQYPDPVDIISAIYLIILSVLCVKVGLSSQKALHDLKLMFTSVDDIKRKITEIRNQNHEILGAGFNLPEGLDKSDFRQLCKDYGIILGKNELDAMVLCLDSDQDGKVGFDELCAWWEHDI